MVIWYLSRFCAFLILLFLEKGTRQFMNCFMAKRTVTCVETELKKNFILEQFSNGSHGPDINRRQCKL